MRSVLLLILLCFILFGCRPEPIPDIQLPELALTVPQKISDIDKNYQRLARNRTLVQIKGTIIHQSKADNSWAFIADETAPVLLDFAAASPNIALSSKQTGKTIIVEGRVSPDSTVMNEYLIVPVTYKIIP